MIELCSLYRILTPNNEPLKTFPSILLEFENVISILKNAPAAMELSAPTTELQMSQSKASTNNVEKTEVESEQFFKALGELADTGIMPAKGAGIENKIKRYIAKNTGSKLLFIIISDLISSRDSILSSARISQRTNNAIILIQTYPDWYSGIFTELAGKEAEKLYDNLKGSIEIEAKLRKMGAYYLRIGPADNTARIVKTIRRST